MLKITQTGRVNHVQWHPLDLYELRYLVTRRACNGRDNGQFSAGQGIEQRALARIGLPGDHRCDALAQDGALLRPLGNGAQALLKRAQLAKSIRLLDEVNVFFWKIQRRLHQHA